MELSKRQEKILDIVRDEGPITGNAIAKKLDVTRSALRSDLSVLTMIGMLDARPKVGYYFVGKSQNNLLVDALSKYKVRDVLSQAVVVSQDMSLYDTIVTIFTEDVGTLLVCEDGYLIGIVSRKDLLRASIGQNNQTTVPVSMIMTPVSKIIVVSPTDTVVEAAQKLIDYEVDCLPVVEKEMEGNKKKYRVIGRISKTNITKLYLECSVPY
ncbi:helix-turn-helix transcriptional regulator [Veillonella montpellierensis]|uniref:helix-turn-helix transcriptional regulator n=1 Tax=Veillonella montpellierensis TaxID=187328 RepID=UPI0003F8C705|nr:helix-turn-helix transcriptional regulator [Veillonella montpellierensis]